MNLLPVLRSPRFQIVGVAATCLLAGFALGAATGSTLVVTPFEKAKFVPMNPKRPDGAQIAVLWGDPTTGPSAALLKYPKSDSGSMHSHTSDYHLVVLEGKAKHWAKGEPEASAPLLGPGSYWFQPGKQPHADTCLSDHCLMFIKWSGKEDAMAAE